MTAIAFVLVLLGYSPSAASEETGESGRLTIIYRLIQQSRLSVHDVSPVGDKERRHNMPFELGVFLGAKKFEPPPTQARVTQIMRQEGIAREAAGCRLERGFLVLAKEGVSFGSTFSDMNAVDPKSYANPIELMEKIRAWLLRRARAEARPETALLKSYGSTKQPYEAFLKYFEDRVRPELGEDLAQIDFENLKLVIETFIKETYPDLASG